MDGLTFLASLLGGGILGALINIAYSESSKNKARKIKYLETQINELYGPVHYFTSQVKKLFELNLKLHNAYKEEFEVKASQYSSGSLDKEADTTLKLANQYISYVSPKRRKIEEIITAHYSLIDTDDVDIFLLFFEHGVRQETEFEENGKLITPDRIFKHMGYVSFLPNDVISRIEKRFLEKKEKLDKLIKSNFFTKDLW